MTATDDRIPVRFGPLAAAGPDDALLIEAVGSSDAEPDHPGAPPLALRRFIPGGRRHDVFCRCCGGRGPVAEALSDLFLSAMRGALPAFRQVLVVPATPAGRAEAEVALRDDRMVRARFRPVDEGGGGR